MATHMSSNGFAPSEKTICTTTGNKGDAASNKGCVARKKYEGMKEIFSVVFFRVTPLDQFRRGCNDCLKYKLLQSSRKAIPQLTSSLSNDRNPDKNYEFNEYIYYDHAEITRRLMNDIDWRSLCEHHDKYEYKRHSPFENLSTKTALYEIVSALTNPMVIPQCCHQKCLIEVFFTALMLSPSASISLQRRRITSHLQHASDVTATNTMLRWSPSQQLLLKTLHSLLSSETMPLDSSTTNYVCKFLASPPLSFTKRATIAEREVTDTSITSSTCISTLTAHKANRLLSAIYWLLATSLRLPSFSVCLERELVFAALLLLQRIDGWSIQIEIELRQYRRIATNSFTYYSCPFCSEDINDRGNTPRKRLRRRIISNMRVETLSSLHDESFSFEDKKPRYLYNNSRKTLWCRSYGKNQKQVSLKDILRMKKNTKSSNGDRRTSRVCRCVKIYRGEKVTLKGMDVPKITEIPNDWSMVRSRAYKKFLAYVVEQRRRQLLRALSPSDIRASIGLKSIAIVQNSDDAFLWWLVTNASMYLESPSRRACLALLAHSLGGPKNPFYFKYVARLLWQGYELSWQHRNSSSSQWLRVYSEWISECAIFDQLVVVWEAIQPIIHHITERLLTMNDRTSSKVNNNSRRMYEFMKSSIDKDEDESNLEHSLLACLGYILHRRSHMFMIFRGNEKDKRNYIKDSASGTIFENDFNSFINLLAIHCEKFSEAWLDLFTNPKRDLVEITLQRLGILSFPNLVSTELPKTECTHTASNINCDVSIHSIAISDWPFSEEFSLRETMGRIDETVMSIEDESVAIKSLLRHPLTVRPQKNHETKNRRKSESSHVCASVTNYLHDSNIMCLIFSFCSPKRLTKIPQVCKEWKNVFDSISNDFWESTYLANFGSYRWPCLAIEHRHLNDSNAKDTLDFISLNNNASKTNWKNIFIQKFCAENLVKFQRNFRTGYKYRTCNFVGCLHILKSAEQEHKHYQKHLRSLAKEKDMITRKTKSKNRKA